MKYDVVVVGAGVAGLTAARDLQRKGLKVAVVEARDRIGGRVDTDTTTFSAPFDTGAHWIHQEEPGQNPLGNWAHKQGISTVPDREELVTGPGADQSGKLNAQIESQEKLWLKSPGDRALSELPSVSGPWATEARNLLVPLSVGVETHQASSRDFNSMVGERADTVVPAGMAAVTHKLAAGLEVRLNSPVQLVEWSQRGCWVTVPGERLECEQVVVTLPVGVLQKDTVRFLPALPRWKREAIGHMQMGNLKKVALEFATGSLDGAQPDSMLQLKGSPALYLLRPGGTEMAIALVGGDTAKAWEKDGEQATQSRVLAELDPLYGPNLKDKLIASKITHWESDPHSGGAYSAALPGHQSARRQLARPVEDLLFFAGEACDEEWATTTAGAYVSGQRAARRVLDSRGV